MKEFLVKHPFISLLMLDTIVTGIENVVITISEAVNDKKYEKKKESFATHFANHTICSVVDGANKCREEMANGQELEENDEGSVQSDQGTVVEQRNRLGFY